MGNNGVWEWNSDKLALHRWAKAYFDSRKEDESPYASQITSYLKPEDLKLFTKTSTVVNHYTFNYKPVIWVVGDGRSGTTWVANLINYHRKFQFLYEPFHPHSSVAMKDFIPFKYLRPHDNKRFTSTAYKVFTGQFHRDDEHYCHLYIPYNGLLIKDIFANLLLKWVDIHFPTVRKILVLRHPCGDTVNCCG